MKLVERLGAIFRSGTVGPQSGGLGRNDDCWCGSGRKYKKCHLEDDEKKLRSKGTAGCGRT